MIDFPCRCGHPFSVSDELAGGILQCPKCKILNDVPLLSDLGRLDDGGIYKLDAAPEPPAHPDRVSELTATFTRDHYDVDGNAIDMRGPVPGGGRPIPVETLQAGEKSPPKYDPITGELVREITIKPSTHPAADALPVLPRAAVARATVVDGIDVPGALEVVAIPFRLLKPINLMVMFFILLGHMLAFGMMAAMGADFFLLAPFWMLVHALIIAHFGNVIDETGPTSRNELPAPLRHVDWHEDTFGPFTRVVSALTICYGPAIFILMKLSPANVPVISAAATVWAILASVFFPAVLLTTCTSGSLLNTRPDRLIAVAILCGPEYLFSVCLWIAGGFFYIAGIVGGSWLAARLLQRSSHPPFDITWPIAIGSLVIGIYLLHLLCWHLGTLYRRHHQQFPWLYQRHSYTHLTAGPKGFPVGRPVRRAARPQRVEPIQQDSE